MYDEKICTYNKIKINELSINIHIILISIITDSNIVKILRLNNTQNKRKLYSEFRVQKIV